MPNAVSGISPVSRKPIWTFGKNKLKRSFKKEKYL
jgi:hypothetical protein